MPADDIERYPRSFVAVHQGTASASNDGNKLSGPVDITPIIRRARVSKNLLYPVGQFEIATTFETLDEFKDSSLNKVLVPDNLCVLAFDKGLPDSDLVTRMEGFVTKVFERTAIDSSGRVEREVVVTGHDAGKFLASHEIPQQIISKRMWGRDEETARIENAAFVSGSPADVVEKVFNGLLKDLTQLSAVTEGAIELLIDRSSLEELGGFTVAEGIWLRHGKFWNILKGVADEPWNELFTDYYPAGTRLGTAADQFFVILRQHPFDQMRWDALPTTTVYDHEIRYFDTAVADDERVNLIFPTICGMKVSNDYPADEIAALYSLFDRESIRKHGAHQRRAQSIYIDTPDNLRKVQDELDALSAGGGTLKALLQRRALKLWNWLSVNHRLYKGSFVVAGNPDIHIGERIQNQAEPSDYFVMEEGERRVYYVEQVIDDYSEDSKTYLTHLGVTRGMPLGTFIEASAPESIAG